MFVRNAISSAPRVAPARSSSRYVASISEEVHQCRQQQQFMEEYKIRTMLEQPIVQYSKRKMPGVSVRDLYRQSQNLTPNFILQNARETLEHLLVFNARRLREFRKLPYLVVLNPSISESYDTYLQSMSSLLKASMYCPHTLEENEAFAEGVLTELIDLHADTLPSLSKGLGEVSELLSAGQVKNFLDDHLKERIKMRLVAHQHLELTKSLKDPASFVPGGKYNGVIKELDMVDVVKKVAEMVNDITMMKYDQSVAIEIDTSVAGSQGTSNPKTVRFPYIEYHLEYMLLELFKNSFRAHIENGVPDPVVVTISISSKCMELRIRDKGTGIPPKALKHIFDYSFTTYESNEGESFKTLNVPPEHLGGGNTIAGMGFGLPLAKQYVEIFNGTESRHVDEENEIEPIDGSLTVQTYPGWGTDVYLKTAEL
ncbi:uncharacterized protein LODBEIA_P05700 [Lodderomyces beijingensis]|uniref:Protein-serine/threonine kinase n=1 Tax=Lodderomyces beijingensis TaxID=1775926 RepID=A0ABP0ZHP4_9ASCO